MIRFELDGNPVCITDDLLARHATTGPRYTSYPTVPAWGPMGPDEWRDALGQADALARAAYVHIPFCRVRCLYCGCNVVVTKSTDKADVYVDHLQREIELTAACLPHRQTTPLVQVHWGGGTPTFLTVPQIERLWLALTDAYPLAPDAEVGIEVDPRATSVEQLLELRRLGFNRLSMGVQDFDPDVQREIGRLQPPELTRELIDAARDAGYGSINVDLIYGLPGQTVERFLPTLDAVMAMGVDRVALFNYAHLPERFRHQQAIDASRLPEGLDKLRLFTTAIERFTGNGYRFIGLDHFARVDDELAIAHDDGTLYRNFMGYSTRAGTDLVAHGASAIAGLRRFYAQNRVALAPWQQTVAAGELPVQRGITLSADDELRREVIMRILCHDGVSRAAIELEFPGLLPRGFDAYFADAMARLAPLREDGLVTDDGDLFVVTDAGRLFVRNVAMCFDNRLDPATSDRPTRYSRTV